MLGTGLPLASLLVLVLLGFLIATTVNTFAMEAAVLFVPAFLFVFPLVVSGFPNLEPNAAIGLALFVELFGYTSSVLAYWFREQIDFRVAATVLVITVPAAVLARGVSYLFPSNLLMLLFGGILVTLAVVLYESHEHGPSILDTVLEKPVAGLSTLSGESLSEEYEPRTRMRSDGGFDALGTNEGTFHFEPIDRGLMVAGGALAGLAGIAIGELTQTMLTVRKRLPITLSTGTSALVLHVTIIAAFATNLVLLRFVPSMAGSGIVIPFRIGAFVALGCLFGGQMGAFLNSRLAESTVMKMLITAYFLVGVFVTGRTLLLGAAH